MTNCRLTSLTLILCLPFFCISAVLAYDCRKAEVLCNKATLSKNFKEKEKFLHSAVSASCEDKVFIAGIYQQLGKAYENNGLSGKAKTAYKKAIELMPDLPTPYLYLGNLYEKTRVRKAANIYYKKYINLSKFRTQSQLGSSLRISVEKCGTLDIPKEYLYLDFNEAELTPESTEQLKDVFTALTQGELNSYRFLIIGHSDVAGSDKYNQLLSENRARAVAYWLLARGFPENRLAVAGFGRSRPAADSFMEEGRKINTRIEIQAIGVMIADVQEPLVGKDREGEMLLEVPRSIKYDNTLFEEGAMLYQSGKYGQASEIFEAELVKFRKQGFAEGESAALGNLYLTYLAAGDTEKALEYLEGYRKKRRKK